jgi:hypothetical protein
VHTVLSFTYAQALNLDAFIHIWHNSMVVAVRSYWVVLLFLYSIVATLISYSLYHILQFSFPPSWIAMFSLNIVFHCYCSLLLKMLLTC